MSERRAVSDGAVDSKTDTITDKPLKVYKEEKSMDEKDILESSFIPQGILEEICMLEKCKKDDEQLPQTLKVKEETSIDEKDILESSFFPQDMILEEKRMHEKCKMDDEQLPQLDDLNEEEKKKRFQNLLKLLENSTKLTNIFETRLKKCKLQIITNEMNKNKKLKENMPNNGEDSPPKIINDDINDEIYLNIFQQPKLFVGQLKNHQIEGLLWIRTLYENGLNGILADDMGLGKTIQTIAFYCFLVEMGIKGPFMVVAPLSTVPNWLSEFCTFSPKLSTLLYHGTQNERIKKQLKFKELLKNKKRVWPIIITTYEVIRFDIKFLKTIEWKFMTIDEGHKLKNINTSISQCMRQLKCDNKLILTGTPIQNDMTELWSLLNLLMPKQFDKLEDFNSWFVIDDFFSSNDKIVNMAKKDEILDIMLKILKPFILRREKGETDLKLPLKKEIVVYAPMTDTQQELYMATLNKHMEILLNKDKENDIIHGVLPKRKCVERIEKYTDLVAIKTTPKENIDESKDVAISVVMQNPFMQLKKLANHPYLVHMPLKPGTQEMLIDESMIKVSGKFQVLDAMLTKLKFLGHKILLFSTMTQILDVVEEFLIFRDYSYTRLDGTMSIENRVGAMKIFNTDPNCFLMIISTRAGGLGLNLTAADTVIIFDSDWNPQSDLQAQDRCYRIGQEKPVVVYRLCTKNTVDDKILERACAKRKLEKMIIGNGTFNISTKLTATGMEELKNLLESSEYNKKIQSNGFIFTDEELNNLLDRSDMIQSKSIDTKSTAEHYKILATS